MAERSGGVGCCNVCSGEPDSSQLKIICNSVAGKRKQRRMRRVVNPHLEEKLKQIRETIKFFIDIQHLI